MVETILKVQGMMCGMCESHINEVVRKTAQVSKVSSSHTLSLIHISEPTRP